MVVICEVDEDFFVRHFSFLPFSGLRIRDRLFNFNNIWRTIQTFIELANFLILHNYGLSTLHGYWHLL